MLGLKLLKNNINGGMVFRAGVASVRKYRFDASDNSKKLDEIPHQTKVEVDGAFSTQGRCVDGGTGVLVTSYDGGFKEFSRNRWRNVVGMFKKDNCCSTVENLALVDGLQFARKLFHEGRISPPIVVISDHQSSVENVEKIFGKYPFNMTDDSYRLCCKICRLLREFPHDTSLIWLKGSRNPAHFLATSVIEVQFDSTVGENSALKEFYDRNFSFKRKFIGDLVCWILKLLNTHKIERDVPVLDVGTGNGAVLQELRKKGFSDLTGTDLSETVLDLVALLPRRTGMTASRFWLMMF